MLYEEKENIELTEVENKEVPEYVAPATFSDSSTDFSVESANAAPKKLGKKAWYVVTTYSTHERRVADYLKRRADSQGFSNLIFRILVPHEDVPIIKDGKDTGNTRWKALFPGNIYVEMIMTDEAWFMIRNTPGVTGFIGSSGKGTKPFPVTREEMEPVLRREGIIDDDMYKAFEVGHRVKIIRGAFADTEGVITSINKDNNEITLEVIYFGKKTPMTVNLSDIDKIA